ncbi:MAG TPA: monovalent cation/H+ antiporter complex subunit F [Spirochaetia bacterium]|nr:monovalent cation/H+ antiporter complex subunit F [Spirochaetia bacterium]
MANLLFIIAGAIATVAGLLMFVRLFLGPTLADRITALDGMTIVAVSFIVFLAYILGRFIYLDVALVYALISFVGVVVLARFIERRL